MLSCFAGQCQEDQVVCGRGKVAGFGLDRNVAARITTRTLVEMAIGGTAVTLAHV